MIGRRCCPPTPPSSECRACDNRRDRDGRGQGADDHHRRFGR
jgi:hypothetical protein